MNSVSFITKLAGFEYTSNIAPNLCDCGVPLFKGKNVQDGEIIYEFESFIPDEISDSLPRSQINRKCILTPYVGTIGNIGIHLRNGKFHLGSNVGKIELYNQNVYLSEEYTVYFLRSNYGYKELTKHIKATAQASISIEALRDVLLPVPPENEQKRIETTIREILSFIEKIEIDKKIIKSNTDKVKSKILDLAIRGKLVPQDPNDEPASVLIERIRAEKEELIKAGKIKRDKKESVIFKGDDNSYYRLTSDNKRYDVSAPFDLPDCWEWTTFPTVAHVELGKTLDKVKNAGTYYPYLRSVNVQWGYVDLSDVKEMKFEPEEIERYTIKKNDLLICEGGDVGRCCVWNKNESILYQNAIHRVRFYNSINCNFYMYFMMYLEAKGTLKRISNGVTIKHLTNTVLSNIIIPLPPLAEQERIVNAVETLFTHIDKIAEQIL